MLALTDIHKTYRLGPVEVEALKGVDLSVETGDLISIMGPSGSGKSTLMNILGLLDRPTSGSYRVGGRNVSTMNDRELSAFRNAHIGFVFQSFNLLGHLTALENTALPLVYRGLSRRETRRRAQDILGKVGMGDQARPALGRPEAACGDCAGACRDAVRRAGGRADGSARLGQCR